MAVALIGLLALEVAFDQEDPAASEVALVAFALAEEDQVASQEVLVAFEVALEDHAAFDLVHQEVGAGRDLLVACLVGHLELREVG